MTDPVATADAPAGDAVDGASGGVYIVGWDGTAGAQGALELALQLRAATGARVLAAHVYGAIPICFAPFGSAPLYGRYEGILRADAEAVLEPLTGVVERRTVCAPSAAQGLHELAVAEAADLVAVGVTHHHGAGTVMPGGTAERVLHGSPCAVAVAPTARAGRGRIARVAVAYDGREPSRRALEAARVLATDVGAQLVLIGVVEPLTPPVWLADEDRRALRAAMLADMHQLLEQAAAGMPLALATRTRTAEGPPAAVLAEASADSDVDLLVLGSRAYGSVLGALVGSVSRAILDRPPCPVLVVPRRAARSPGVTDQLAAVHR